MEVYILKDCDCNVIGAYNDVYLMYNSFVKYYTDMYPEANAFLLESPYQIKDILKFFSEISFCVEVYTVETE